MEWLVNIHNVWRYAVLIAALGALILSLLAYLGNREWDSLADRFSLFFTIAMDIQVVIGILVWVLADYNKNDSFLRWIHPIAMLASVGLAHVGRTRSERAVGSKSKGGTAALFFGASLLVVLLAIPLAAWPI